MLDSGDIMPFTSKAQARYMFATHPRIAKKMAKTTGGKGSIKRLPQHSSKASHNGKRVK